MTEEEISEGPITKVHEKTDFEQWIFEYELEMAKVQSDGEIALYEMMRNTLLNKLIPYMSDDQKKRYDEIRANKKAPLVERIESKERITSEILNSIGAQFTQRKKAEMKGGMALLWQLHPPYQSQDLTQSDSKN